MFHVNPIPSLESEKKRAIESLTTIFDGWMLEAKITKLTIEDGKRDKDEALNASVRLHTEFKRIVEDEKYIKDIFR